MHFLFCKSYETVLYFELRLYFFLLFQCVQKLTILMRKRTTQNLGYLVLWVKYLFFQFSGIKFGKKNVTSITIPSQKHPYYNIL